MSEHPKLTRYELRKIAVASDGVNEQTIAAYLAGERETQPSTRVRIERGLLALGLAHMIRGRVDIAPRTFIAQGPAGTLPGVGEGGRG